MTAYAILNLQKRIDQQRQDAEKKSISPIAQAIAETLGHAERKNHGAWHFYKDDEIRILYDDYGCNLVITYKDKDVFATQLGKIAQYRPDIQNGEWITKLTKIYNEQVCPILKKKKDEEQQLAELEIFEKWGIKP